MTVSIENRFMINPAAAGYGHRVWLSADHYEMVQALKPLSMWGGVDKRCSDVDYNEIVSLEIRAWDDGENLAKVREVLATNGFTEIVTMEEKSAVFQKYSGR